MRYERKINNCVLENIGIPDGKKDEKPERMVDVGDDKRDISKIKISNRKYGRPCRYQRKVDHAPNKGVKIVTNFLNWLRSVVLDK